MFRINNTGHALAKVALFFLMAGVLVGFLSSLQYLFPGLLNHQLPFYISRPLHVHLVLNWILAAALACIYFFISRFTGTQNNKKTLQNFHVLLFGVTAVLILINISIGNFEGREYFEYPVWLGIPVLLTWLLFLYIFLRHSVKIKGPWPVYLWMWTTGIISFVVAYSESFLWLIPWFGGNAVRDITVQWKSLGALVGSWNMLIYGTAFFVMEKINGNKETARSRITFFFYFLGLINLLFNWGHHTYIVPASSVIKNTAFIISMTELLILGNIMLNWRITLSNAVKNKHLISVWFFTAADIWIFLNLILAILISVPAINYYTHGTYITVAHAMGATIGINTMILLAALSFFLLKDQSPHGNRWLAFGFRSVNFALPVFWAVIIFLGIHRALHLQPGNTSKFYIMMNEALPVMKWFAVSGFVLMAGLIIAAMALMNKAITGTGHDE
ncbi:MAG: cbb3-type cytochrome c oxidase subunit I [Bacteroidia bacterium]|nr:cbb3-type cytochrome c oxidase subunit I [Bacteroidia bacterium]